MKKAIILSLIFYGYQFLVALLFILINVIRKEPNPTALGVNALGLSVLLSGLMMVGHLIYCRVHTPLFAVSAFRHVFS